MELRPDFVEIKTGHDFDQWYWSKEELTEICRASKIPHNARKNELRRRIIQCLNGEPLNIEQKVIESNFDWARAELSPDTLITDSIKFGKNLRSFMKAAVGPKFSFSNAFMVWMREHTGHTLADAIEYWHALQVKTKAGYRMDMSDFNVMNKYLDDFLKANPTRKRDEGLQCWYIKKMGPAPGGQVKYEPKDLNFLLEKS